MKLSKEDKKTIPIWVKFYNIPLEYWDGDGLGRIASAVGVPLFMDQLTSSGSRISFARLCVDISAESAFPDSFLLTDGDISMNIHVEYQGVPSRCTHCHGFGHETKTCLSAQVTHLIELQKNSEERVEDDGGWTTVKDKGKRKVGDPSSPINIVPTEANNSSATKGDDLIPEVQSEGDALHPVVEEIAEFATDQIDPPFPEVVEIANPAAEEVIKNAGKEEMRASSPEMQGGKEDGGLKVCSSTKKKSSGKSGSQKKKKRGFNNPSKHKEVTDFVKKEDIKIMSILETKLKWRMKLNFLKKALKIRNFCRIHNQICQLEFGFAGIQISVIS
ncbi:uncharacterized protein LOC114306486 [Camellia sinensis]|uniref:uncharacterized protein LOC114306486 n=1 Tax=Camellia sinensis TaxID=4442 RepID=UPI001035D723|nr:uncharacterized protein LOC114306486 [Camellia sinensis]